LTNAPVFIADTVNGPLAISALFSHSNS